VCLYAINVVHTDFVFFSLVLVSLAHTTSAIDYLDSVVSMMITVLNVTLRSNTCSPVPGDCAGLVPDDNNKWS